MSFEGKRIILGSGSPRRKELLAGMDIEFTVDTGNSFEENVPAGIEPRQVPVLMSQGKSHGFHRSLEDGEILITADTVVIIPASGEVLGKPHSHEEAVSMLKSLSGIRHEVVTAVTIRDTEREVTFSDITEVDFAELSDDEIEYYVDRYKPYDKAGAYAVQEWIGHTGIVGIHGSYFNVVGLPVQKLFLRLKEFTER